MFSSSLSCLIDDKAEAHKGEWPTKVIQQVEAAPPPLTSLLPLDMPRARDRDRGVSTYLFT